ncbi:MAG TPA: hypothetical protein VIJ22_07795 [Polyangiaceae bacterium]
MFQLRAIFPAWDPGGILCEPSERVGKLVLFDYDQAAQTFTNALELCSAATVEIGGGACTQGFQCCSGSCDMGTCIDTGTFSCQGIGGACTQTSECCSSSVVGSQSGSARPRCSESTGGQRHREGWRTDIAGTTLAVLLAR